MRLRLPSLPSRVAVRMPGRITLRWKLASLLIFIAVLVVALILLPLGDGVEGLLEKRAVRKNKRRRSGDVARRDQFNRWDRGGNSYF